MGALSPNKGVSPSTETRAKISASLMGNQNGAATRARKSSSHLGKKHSAETRAKISAALAGKPKSAEHKAKIGASRKRSDQIMRESEPVRECGSSPEMRLPGNPAE
jgi:hypothetical protein